MPARPCGAARRGRDAGAAPAGEAGPLSGALIRSATAADAAAIAAIYAYYVRETPITFETEPPDAAEMGRRIAAVQPRYPYLVAEDADGALLGYAYAGSFKERAAYRWVAETTVYLDEAARGRGIGRALYAALLDTMRARGLVAAVGVIALPNAASIALHEAMGFVGVGVLAKVGYKLGRWHDVGYWQAELAPRDAEPAEPR